MDQKRALFLIGGIILLLLVVIFGVAYASSKRTPRKNTKTVTSNIPRESGSPQNSFNNPQSSGSAQLANPNQSTLAGQGFTLRYPKSWGLLRCNNSANVELDPVNSTDQLSVSCDYAVKPVTILVVNQPSCSQGESVKLGNINATKVKTVKPNGDISYKWCVNGISNNLEVTHRVSQSGSRATSKDDFSTQVEEILSTYSQAPAGS